MTAETERAESLPMTAVTVVRETVALPVSVEKAMEEWEQYQQLTRRLLDDSDYQAIGQKKFKKKSAWRKYARAFNISDRVTYEHIERSLDGFPLWARIRVEASAPNGRVAEADHECHVNERCCPTIYGAACPKTSWRNHTCCQPGCSGRVHFAHPGDIPATATTRAKNRAISDLIGAGEVSAEEMEGQRDNAYEGESSGGYGGEQRSARRQAPARPRPAPTPTIIDGEATSATSEAPAAVVEQTPAVHQPTPEQIGKYARPTGGINQAALLAEATRQGANIVSLGKVAPHASGAARAFDAEVWLSQHPDKTLDDLIAEAKS